MKVDAMTLTPTSAPPNASARWCPSCGRWIERQEIRGRRRCHCGAAVVRQTFRERSVPGQLRPGIIAEFSDPRDRYNPARELAELRARLTLKAHEVLGQ